MFPVYGDTDTDTQDEPAVVMYQPDLDQSTPLELMPEPPAESITPPELIQIPFEGAIQNAHNKIHQLIQFLPQPDGEPLQVVPEKGEATTSVKTTEFKEFAKRVGVKDGYTAQEVSDDQILASVEKTYSTAQAAAFFPSKKKNKDGSPKDMSNQWLYWGMKNGLFVDENGKTIKPLMVGKRRRFTLDQIEAIALSWHRRGNLSLDELKIVLRRILIARHGMEAFDSDDPPTS